MNKLRKAKSHNAVQTGVSALNEYPFTSEYDDFIIGVTDFKEGASAYVYYPDEGNTSGEGIVVKFFCRSDNPEWYDSLDDAFITEFGEEYDVSGEFITDSDCFYVFIKYNI